VAYKFETLIALIRGEEKPELDPIFKELLEEYRVLVAAAGIVMVAGTATAAMAEARSR